MPRFAVLTHDHPFLHWDLLLEHGDCLRSWRLLREPTFDQGIAAEALPDHRPLYLDYEGPVGGGRGEVRRWDRGDYETESESETRIVVRIRGDRLSGRATLQASGVGWTIYFRCDRSARREKPNSA